MRYTCPDDCAGVTHAGVRLTRDRDGTIDAAPEAAPALAPHGIVPAPAPPPQRRADDRRMLR